MHIIIFTHMHDITRAHVRWRRMTAFGGRGIANGEVNCPTKCYLVNHCEWCWSLLCHLQYPHAVLKKGIHCDHVACFCAFVEPWETYSTKSTMAVLLCIVRLSWVCIMHVSYNGYVMILICPSIVYVCEPQVKSEV